MPKLRKMLGNADSPVCVSMMRLIETQSAKTLASWALGYAKRNYLPLYHKEYPDDMRLEHTAARCESYLRGELTLAQLRPVLTDVGQLARDASLGPVAQAAARAVSTACAAVRTPTNTLGFLFYGAAAAAYDEAGLDQPAARYDELALLEWTRAYDSLRAAAVTDEPHPVKIKWNC